MAPERKQVKKFLKPKIEVETSGGNFSNGRGRGVLVVGTVTVLAAALYFAPAAQTVWKSMSPTPANDVLPTHVEQPHPKMATKSGEELPKKSSPPKPSKPDNAIPTYDEYIQQAEENQWQPTDPVLKLETSILKFSQLFDVVDTSDTAKLNQFLQMMSQEMQYLLAILAKSTDRSINLTPALRNAIDIIQEVTYRSMKLQLSTGQSKQTTRAQITNNLKHWVYSPLRELIKLMSTKPVHITMDVNDASLDPTGSKLDAALVRVVKSRIYGLISVFLSVDATPETVFEALRVAVVQGDDLGVALLLNPLAGANGASSIPNHALLAQAIQARLSELSALANKLQFTHIAGRIGGVADRMAGKVGALPAGVIPADKVDIFNEYFPYERVIVPAGSPLSGTTSPLPGDVDPVTGYSTYQFQQIYSADADGSNSSEGFVNQCAIDRVDLADLSVGRFYSEYVVLNRPVVITHSLPHVAKSSASTTAATKDPMAVWHLDSLLKRFGSTREVVSAIPYATLFGHKEEIVPLKDFVQHPSKGMQEYTKQLMAASEALGPALSEQQLLEVAASVGLPLYIFSGVQQSMNKAMRKHMQSVLAHSTAAPSSRSLLELMYSVAKGYNVTVAETAAAAVDGVAPLHKDFKPHWKSQFYLGPALSGAPFHHHGPAFNLLVHGRKEWTIMPPGRDVYSSMHPLDWLREGGATSTMYPYHGDTSPAAQTSAAIATSAVRTDKPCKLIQTPGEVLFVPRHWSHQILNLAESVGFAIEIDDYTA